MNSNNAAIRQDVIENSVDHQISALTNPAASPGQIETLLNSELDHDLIEWPRKYLETYLDSDSTGRVPLNTEQLQDVLEAAFDRDATLARDYLEELNGERGPTSLGDSTLQIVVARSEGKDTGYELLFDPTDNQDLKHLIEKLDMRAWEKMNAQMTPTLETKRDVERRETTASVATHQPGSGAIELHDKVTGRDVRKLLGGGELPSGLESALKKMGPDTLVRDAQTDSGIYRGAVIGETGKSLIQQITSRTVVIHPKDLLDKLPAVGENVRIAYSNDIARVLPVKARSKTQEMGR
jgi:hypothetical protein